MLSADNISKRPPEQIRYLFDLIDERLPELIRRRSRWAPHVSGDLELLPPATAAQLREAEAETADRPAHLIMAIRMTAGPTSWRACAGHWGRTGPTWTTS